MLYYAIRIAGLMVAFAVTIAVIGALGYWANEMDAGLGRTLFVVAILSPAAAASFWGAIWASFALSEWLEDRGY